jgi:hypothetical protein
MSIFNQKIHSRSLHLNKKLRDAIIVAHLANKSRREIAEELELHVNRRPNTGLPAIEQNIPIRDVSRIASYFSCALMLLLWIFFIVVLVGVGIGALGIHFGVLHECA